MHHLLAITALAACTSAAPTRASAQQIGVSINFGPPQTVLVYDPAYFGPWRTAYMDWEPVTLYVVNGVYYERPIRDARVVMVYRRGHEYFLPPREREWVGVDQRFDYEHGPRKWDYEHGKHHGNGRGRGHEK